MVLLGAMIQCYWTHGVQEIKLMTKLLGWWPDFCEWELPSWEICHPSRGGGRSATLHLWTSTSYQPSVVRKCHICITPHPPKKRRNVLLIALLLALPSPAWQPTTLHCKLCWLGNYSPQQVGESWFSGSASWILQGFIPNYPTHKMRKTFRRSSSWFIWPPRVRDGPPWCLGAGPPNTFLHPTCGFEGPPPWGEEGGAAPCAAPKSQETTRPRGSTQRWPNCAVLPLVSTCSSSPAWFCRCISVYGVMNSLFFV